MRDGDLKTELKVLEIYNTFISNMQGFLYYFTILLLLLLTLIISFLRARSLHEFVYFFSKQVLYSLDES